MGLDTEERADKRQDPQGAGSCMGLVFVGVAIGIMVGLLATGAGDRLWGRH